MKRYFFLGLVTFVVALTFFAYSQPKPPANEPVTRLTDQERFLQASRLVALERCAVKSQDIDAYFLLFLPEHAEFLKPETEKIRRTLNRAVTARGVKELRGISREQAPQFMPEGLFEKLSTVITNYDQVKFLYSRLDIGNGGTIERLFIERGSALYILQQ